MCRVVYGLLQTRFADASRRYDSVDLEYMYIGANPLYHKAVHANRAGAGGSLEFNVGDKVEVRKTFWNGTSSGHLIRHNGTDVTARDFRGSFPAYKLEEDLETF